MESADRRRQNPAPTPLELEEPPDQNASAAHARTRAHRQKLNLAHFGAEFRAGKRFQAPTRPQLSVWELKFMLSGTGFHSKFRHVQASSGQTTAASAATEALGAL